MKENQETINQKTENETTADGTAAKNGIRWYNIIALILLWLFAFGLYAISFRYMVFLQHRNMSDGAFFSGNGLWIGILNSFSGIFKMSAVEFCHKVLPPVFCVLMFWEYVLTGAVIFSKEKRGKYYTFFMTGVFISIFLMIIHMGAYSDLAIEGGAYLAPWQGRNLAGIIITPILMMGLFSEKKGRKTLLIIISCVLYFVTNTKDSISELSGGKTFADIIKSYIDVAWLPAAAGLVLIMAFSLGWESFRPVIISFLIAMVFLVPAPLGLIASYGMTKLVGWGLCEKDDVQEYFYQTLGRLAVFAGFIVLITFVGLSSETRVTWVADYSKITNKYRLTQDIVDICELIDDKENDVKVYSFDIIDSEVSQYSVAACDGRLKNISLGDVDDWSQETEVDIVKNISSEGGYLILYNFTDVDSSLMEEYGVTKLMDSDIYTLYGLEK